jgi:hypothetical protein
VQEILLQSVHICCRGVVYLLPGSCVSAVRVLCICCQSVVYLLSGCRVSAVGVSCICCRGVVYLLSGSCVSAVRVSCICCRGVVYLLSGCCVSAVPESCVCCRGVVYLLSECRVSAVRVFVYLLSGCRVSAVGVSCICFQGVVSLPASQSGLDTFNWCSQKVVKYADTNIEFQSSTRNILMKIHADIFVLKSPSVLRCFYQVSQLLVHDRSDLVTLTSWTLCLWTSYLIHKWLLNAVCYYAYKLL